MTKVLPLREQVGRIYHYHSQVSQLAQSTKVGEKVVATFLSQPMRSLT